MNKRRKLFAGVAFVALASGIITSCTIDDAYDLDKDFDMTMGIGVDGLALKLGNTDSVMLNDVLDIEDNDLVETDNNNLYYLVKSNRSDFDVTVEKALGTINGVEIVSDQNIIGFGDLDNPTGAASVEVENGKVFTQNNVSGSNDISSRISDISEEINRIKRIYPKQSLFDLKLEVYSNNSQLRFNVKDIRNMKISFPEYLDVDGVTSDYTLTLKDVIGVNSSQVNLGQVNLNSLFLDKDVNSLGLLVETDKGGNRYIDITGMIKMQGDFELVSARRQNMNSGDVVKVRLLVDLTDGGEFVVNRLVGEVNPVINPDIDPVAIGNDLPDFLRDDSVTIEAKNPTIKFSIDGTDLPVPVEFSGNVSSMAENGSSLSSVDLPESGKVDVPVGKNAVYYFSKEQTPYDPTGVDPSATVKTVSDLNELVRKLPDNIRVDCNDGKVNVKQGVLHDIKLDTTYRSSIDYDIFVPFSFNGGTTIVYNDSIDDMNEDLKDYQAHGLVVTGDAYNTIPMKLLASIEPVDVDGNVIKGISVTEADIAAGKGINSAEADNGAVKSNIEISLTAEDPADVSRLDKLRFRVVAASEAQGDLCSNQYFLIKNLRLKLKGQIIGDFN